MSHINKCPDIEELSAWADNETTKDYSEHCSSCQTCKEIVEDFQKVDFTIGDLLRSPQADKSMPEQIMAKINHPTPKQFTFVRNAAKIAAILIAALILTKFYNPTTNNTAKSKTPDTVKEKIDNRQFVLKAPENKDIVEEAIPGGGTIPRAIPSEDFRVVGIAPETVNINASFINNEVKHVWTTTTPAETADLLKRLAINGIILREKSSTEKIQLEISLTDKQLVEVVNRLANEGNFLISRDLPQPNSNSTVTTVGNLIRYNVTIIKKN